MSFFSRGPNRAPTPPEPTRAEDRRLLGQRDARYEEAAGGQGAPVQRVNKLTVGNCPSQDLVRTNFAYVADSPLYRGLQYLRCGSSYLNVQPHPAVREGVLGLNAYQRRALKVALDEEVEVAPAPPPGPGRGAALLECELDAAKRGAAAAAAAAGGPGGAQPPLDLGELQQRLGRLYGGQILHAGQTVYTEFANAYYNLRIVSVLLAPKGGGGDPQEGDWGLVGGTTVFNVRAAAGSQVVIKGQKAPPKKLFREENVNFERLGIGGLEAQFRVIFRRAFASRTMPPALREKLGVKHVKGMLLHGPPGTGKTLIARQLGRMLNAREPKVVNGPEVLNKFVGASEENIRNLFKDAEAEQAASGYASGLHIIIFDEIDAICKSRGSARDGTGVGDSVVNQLLTKIDGINALDNVLLIGMTNRKDMLDEALLRPGRLELQVEIGLPDEAGRQQILQIHTSRIAENSFLSREVDLGAIAARTKNYSGAELEGVVNAAIASAMARHIDPSNIDHLDIDEDNIQITMADFEAGLEDVKAAFGQATELLEQARPFGMLACGEAHRKLRARCERVVRQVREGANKSPILSLLLEGPLGTGKTALAATLGMESGLPFVRLLSPDSLRGLSEQAKINAIVKVFDDAYRSPVSLVILDSLEELFEYVDVGPRFSNPVLQVLKTVVAMTPPPGHRLLVVGTTSGPGIMRDTGLRDKFRKIAEVPPLRCRSGDVAEALAALGAFPQREMAAAVEALGVDAIALKPLLDLVSSAQDLAGKGNPVSAADWSAALLEEGPRLSAGAAIAALDDEALDANGL